MNNQEKKDLRIFAAQIRIALLEELKARGFGHVGGSLSICDLLAVLYGKVMNYKPEDPKWADRDKVVSSKGHAGPALYATLALKGFFPMDELKTLNRPGTNLPSHCDKNKTIGIDCTTGSLGQGTSQAVGMALGDKLKGRPSRTFLIVGDGEIDEGQCWEAAMFTAGAITFPKNWFTTRIQEASRTAAARDRFPENSVYRLMAQEETMEDSAVTPRENRMETSTRQATVMPYFPRISLRLFLQAAKKPESSKRKMFIEKIYVISTRSITA